jgi:DNA-binding NarL/FixJ family response regulator
MASDRVTTFLADDHAMVREGLAALVSADESIEIIGQCGDGLNVVKNVQELEPDVLALDISMPGLNGIDICREVHRKCDGTAVLILTMYSDEEFVIRALQHGALGYLIKDSAADKLAEAIHQVARGETYLGPGVSETVLERIDRSEKDPYDKLSTRERQVLQLIAEGQTNRAIAEKLGLATKTVDTHRTRLMRKLNIHDQTTLVKFAIRRGVIDLS